MREIEVRILGLDLVLKTDETEEHVRRVADYVDGVAKKILETGRNMSADRVAILTSLQIADELFKSREKKENLSREIEERSARLLERIEGM